MLHVCILTSVDEREFRTQTVHRRLLVYAVFFAFILNIPPIKDNNSSSHYCRLNIVSIIA